MTHPYLQLAHQSIEYFLETGQFLPPPTPLSADLQQPAALFVTIYDGDGKLRGCRGVLTPTQPTLAEAIIKMAVASATDDPRFPPMMPAETPTMQLKIDILNPLEPVEDVSQLDEKVYGVLVKTDRRRAVLLPNISGIESVPHQLALVRRKAGIAPEEPAKLYRFTVTRYDINTPVDPPALRPES